LDYEFSTTLDKDFCLKALREALKVANPEIFNTDQDRQFASDAFPGILKKAVINTRWTTEA